MLLQLEQECHDIYRKKVEMTRKYRAELHRSLADGQAQITAIASALGEATSFPRARGTLRDQISAVKPVLEELSLKKQERVKDFSVIQSQIARISSEIAGNGVAGNAGEYAGVDETDLTLKRLGELKSHLEELHKEKADILVRGYAGWNSRRAVQVLEQVFPKDATIQPSLVMVYFGGNDSMRPNPLGLGPHVPLPEYIENMRKIATHLQSLSEKTRIIFLSAPPVNEEQIREQLSGIIGELNRTNKLCKIYSDACLELCREMDIKAVDLCTSIQKRKDWETTCFTDGIHLSSEGSKIVAEEILKVLKEADWEPSLQWNSLATEFGEDSPYDPVGTDGKTMNVSDDGVARLMQWGISNRN